MISKNKSEDGRTARPTVGALAVLAEGGWRSALAAAQATPRFAMLAAFLAAERRAGKILFPPEPRIFAALEATPFDAVRCVILGQDPYHGDGEAHGLAFSVPDGVRLPPSLRNIRKELEADIGVPFDPKTASGDLTPWTKQGVLLLNTSLTVERDHAGSHAGKGWEELTDAALTALAADRDGLAFVLWGAHAQKKAVFLDSPRHFVLKSPHPSPLSSHRGFFGSRPFSRVNAYLKARGEEPIDWTLA